MEIKAVHVNSLLLKDGSPCNNKIFGSRLNSDEVFVSTVFGIIGGLLRSRDINSPFFKSDKFTNELLHVINSVDLEDSSPLPTESQDSKKDGIQIDQERLLKAKKDTEELKKALEASREIISRLEMQIKKSAPTFESTSKTGISPNVEDINSSNDLRPLRKRKSIEQRTNNIKKEIDDICANHRETLGTVLGYQIINNDEHVMNTLDDVVDIVTESKGTKQGFESIFSKEKWQEYFKSLRKPDWVLLYFKLKAKIPDDSWQTLLNITYLGRTNVSKTFNFIT